MSGIDQILDFIVIVESIFLMHVFKYCFFLENNTPKDRKRMWTMGKVAMIALIFPSVSTILFDLLYNPNVPLLLLILMPLNALGMVGLFLSAFLMYFSIIYSSWTHRKKHKWLAIFILIPLNGYNTALSELILLIPKKIMQHNGVYNSDTHKTICSVVGYTILCAVVFFIMKKKPKWYLDYNRDIAERSLSFMEQAGLWAVGIWILIAERIAGEKMYQLGNGPEIFFVVTTAAMATVVLLLITDSNRKTHYFNKNLALQKSLIMTMSDLVENRDENTGGHIQRTAKYVEIIAKGLKAKGLYLDILTDKYIEDMVIAAPLHDVGKIRIPDAVLNKPGRLDDEEFVMMKNHTEAGKTIIDQAEKMTGEINYFVIAKQMAESHHEWVNGNGYPKGIKGDEIPLCAKILAVADVFDALVSKRCYKDPMPLDKAYAIIREGSGTHFEPAVVDAFFDAQAEIEEVVNCYAME